MPSQTRDRILSTARQLFNECGYRQVTMRQIADKLGISPGNLTYYFKHKNDIVAELMDESFDQTYLKEPIRSFEDLLGQFRRMLETVQRNAFYFLDPEFRSASRPHNDMIRERLMDGFDYLIGAGVLSDAFTPEVQKTVLDILFLAHMTWIASTARGQQSMSLDEFIEAHRVLLKPYLL